MVQLRTRRTAIFLYSVLLVLPTAVLGGLQWRLITREHEVELDLVPERARHLSARVRNVLGERLRRMLDFEAERPFDHYAVIRVVREAGGETVFLPSPLETDAPAEGIQAWFVYGRAGSGPEPRLFRGPARAPDDGAGLLRAVDEIRAADRRDGLAETDGARLRVVSAAEVALLGATTGIDLECVRRHLPALEGVPMEVVVGDLRMGFFRQDDDRPRFFAMRRVAWGGRREAEACLTDLLVESTVQQGFFFDPEWFFERLPADVATDLMDATDHYVPMGAPPCCPGQEATHVSIHPISEFKIDTLNPEDNDFGAFTVAVDTTAVDARFRHQGLRFLALAGMLALTLATGMALLLRSVSRDLEQAVRTENFVASVTHELKTPLSGIKLHAEMLLDGWAQDPAVQKQYYRRIVRETDRLSTLVERVLEKGRLASTPVQPVPASLSDLVDEVVAPLLDDPETAGRDLALELEAGLPLALVTTEAVRSILVNLVENARKYAPVKLPDDGAPADPIVVRTRRSGDRVLLEVSDRGPGIEAAEAQHVFEAFYRVGDEATRTSRGTGLGLHLVALQAESLGGRVSVHPRPGGGSTFRVALRIAPAS